MHPHVLYARYNSDITAGPTTTKVVALEVCHKHIKYEWRIIGHLFQNFHTSHYWHQRILALTHQLCLNWVNIVVSWVAFIPGADVGIEWRIIGHLSQNVHTSHYWYQRILFSSHPPLSQLSQMVVSRAFYSKCIGRVHTSRLVAQGGEGREEVTFGAWHTFQHHSLSLSGHGLSPRYQWWFFTT